MLDLRFACLAYAQAQHEPAPTEADRLRAQRGLLPLAARFLILHSAKLVALAVFWAAMQLPGAIGWVLTGGGFMISPARVTVAFGNHAHRAVYGPFLASTLAAFVSRGRGAS
jgi:hypothetical protein